MQFAKIVIIFNPNSTGDSPSMARQFAKEIRYALPSTEVELLGTEFAGHAEELAYTAASSQESVLIVSVSGDGGYNEVINGAMRAEKEHGTKPICAILPGGNANDHHTSVSRRPLKDAILAGDVSRFDLLAVCFDGNVRYAHSYAGLGLTPLVAQELNKYQLNRFREIWLTIKTYFTLRAFTIVRNDRKVLFDSILMIVIDRMAKHLTLAPGRRPISGSFDLIRIRHRSKRRLITMVIRSLLGRRIPHRTVTEYSFATTTPLPMQLDGELLDLPKDTKIVVKIAPRKLRTLI